MRTDSQRRACGHPDLCRPTHAHRAANHALSMPHELGAPEARLLFLTANPAPAAAVGPLFSQGLDWRKLIQLAQREGAAAVLHSYLASGNTAAPGSSLNLLRKLAAIQEFRLLTLQRRLEESLDALHGAGIEVVLLKGAALAASVYGSFTDRPMSDLDLLVPPKQIERARKVLLASGWRWDDEQQSDSMYAVHHHLPPLIDGRGGGSVLELHRDLFPCGHPFGVLADDIRRRARTVRFAGRDVQVPAPEDQLLHAALHFAWSNMMARGAWRTFRDVSALLRHSTPDCDRLVALANNAQGASCSYWTFRLARSLAGVAVPAAALVALRPQVPEFVLGRIEQHFTQRLLRGASSCPSLRAERLLWSVAIQPAAQQHGQVRPWKFDLQPAHASAAHSARPRRRATSVATKPVRRAVQWGRFVSLLIRRPAPASVSTALS